jgi:hypothetical protein
MLPLHANTTGDPPLFPLSGSLFIATGWDSADTRQEQENLPCSSSRWLSDKEAQPCHRVTVQDLCKHSCILSFEFAAVLTERWRPLSMSSSGGTWHCSELQKGWLRERTSSSGLDTPGDEDTVSYGWSSHLYLHQPVGLSFC